MILLFQINPRSRRWPKNSWC